MVYRVMERLKNIPAASYILACPEDSSAAFQPLADEAGFCLYAGPKNDVLARYCQALEAARKSGKTIDWCIRATGDNPFVNTDAAIQLFDEAVAEGADYAGYQELPYGAGVEVVRVEALLRANREVPAPSCGVCPMEREHVCPYLYKHPEIFRLYRPLAPEKWRNPELRVTVDTEEDYRLALERWK
jgi:spore coat polysaccharide biosynthesis protein SpsF